MEWSIQEVARLAGTTSRTLRYYDQLMLVSPSRVGANGYRYYDPKALRQLQRVLLLRELGLGLSAIAELIREESDEVAALHRHQCDLEQERQRIDRQIAAVKRTVSALQKGETIMAAEMLDGFDHRKYRDEVRERWGEDSYQKSDSWWSSMSPVDRRGWTSDLEDLNHDWIAAHEDTDHDPTSERSMTLAKRHIEWLSSIPGTPAAEDPAQLSAYVNGLAEMYVCDERFATNYGGTEGARFVAESLRHYLACHL